MLQNIVKFFRRLFNDTDEDEIVVDINIELTWVDGVFFLILLGLIIYLIWL